MAGTPRFALNLGVLGVPGGLEYGFAVCAAPRRCQPIQREMLEPPPRLDALKRPPAGGPRGSARRTSWGGKPVGRDEPKLGRREALSVVVAVTVVVVVRLRISRLQFVSSAGEEQ
jgi:hypothetical protein